MAKLEKSAGIISEIWQILIQDTNQNPLPGLTATSPGLIATYHRDTDVGSTAITLTALMTLGTYTSGGFKEIDSVKMPGWYQFCPPNAALAAGARSVAIHLQGATNMFPLPMEVQLVSNYNPDAALQSYPNNFAVQAIDANGRVQALVDVQRAIALPNFTFLLTDGTTHTPLTGKVDANFTFKVRRIDASGFVVLSGTITEVDATNLPGVYQINLSAAELNGKVITLYFATSGSDVVCVTLVTSN